MSLVDNNILKRAIAGIPPIDDVHEALAAKALRRDVEQNNAMIEDTLIDIVNFMYRSIRSQIIDGLVKANVAKPLNLVPHQCTER